MAKTEVGYDSQRATALTVLLPLKVGSTPLLAGWLWFLRRRFFRHRAVGALDRQRFVLAIRWSLLPPFSRTKRWWPFQRPADTRRFLLFESNFDGDWDEYLDVFGAVMPGPIQTLIYWGRGFPGLDDIDLFKRYAKAHDVVPDHYRVGFHMTAADLYQAAISLEGHRSHLKRIRHGYGVDHPRWSTFLLPLRAERVADAQNIARTFSDELPGSCPFTSTGLVHFARVVVLRRPSGSWLLVTVTHDAQSTASLARTLAYGRHQRELAELLACTTPAPDEPPAAWTPGQLAELLIDAEPRDSRHRMAYCGHTGRTVSDVLDLQERAMIPTDWPEPELP